MNNLSFVDDVDSKQATFSISSGDPVAFLQVGTNLVKKASKDRTYTVGNYAIAKKLIDSNANGIRDSYAAITGRTRLEKNRGQQNRFLKTLSDSKREQIGALFTGYEGITLNGGRSFCNSYTVEQSQILD